MRNPLPPAHGEVPALWQVFLYAGSVTVHPPMQGWLRAGLCSMQRAAPVTGDGETSACPGLLAFVPQVCTTGKLAQVK